MCRVTFEKFINSLDYGWEQYQSVVTNLEKLLDSAAINLSEDEYEDFKIILKESILEDL